MLRRGFSIRSRNSCIRHLFTVMASAQAHDLQGLQGSCKRRCNGISVVCQCSKSPFIRTASSCSTSNGQGKITDESAGCKSRETGELQELQWDKLSEDEKNIYLVHKNACMVRSQSSTRVDVKGWK